MLNGPAYGLQQNLDRLMLSWWKRTIGFSLNGIMFLLGQRNTLPIILVCFCGCSDAGTYFHIWWDCPVAQKSQKAVFDLALKVLETTIQLDPATALLNLKPDGITQSQFCLLLQLLTVTKQTIAKTQKTQSLVIAEIVYTTNRALVHAKMAATENDRIYKYEKLWQPWVKLCLPSDSDDTVSLVTLPHLPYLHSYIQWESHYLYESYLLLLLYLFLIFSLLSTPFLSLLVYFLLSFVLYFFPSPPLICGTYRVILQEVLCL